MFWRLNGTTNECTLIIRRATRVENRHACNDWFQTFAGDLRYGGKHEDTKPLKGFGGAGVLEIVSDHVGDTFRAVDTVKFASAIYVLHAFQKKSKTGSKTPGTDMALMTRRLRIAQSDYDAKLVQGRKL
jgi:phage-related protein